MRPASPRRRCRLTELLRRGGRRAAAGRGAASLPPQLLRCQPSLLSLTSACGTLGASCGASRNVTASF